MAAGLYLKDFIGEYDDNLCGVSDLTINDLENEIIDYEQNVARASFGDMVNDYERNELYYKAIQKSVTYLKKEKGIPSVRVFDIGCGTGLLSMMSVKAGADKVIACEGFKPMADCAKKIVAKNRMSEQIEVINVLSNNLKISDPKPNLLVAELLDTELIGEGCLFTYKDAVSRLTNKDTLFVPSRARVYFQLVQSEKMFYYHHFRKSYSINNQNVEPVCTPVSAYNCFGSHLFLDQQINRLKPGEDFEILSEPQVIFEFEFNNPDKMPMEEFKRIKVPLIAKFDKPILIFSWWDVDMDFEGEIVLSCAPYWARGLENENQVAWRDHWMQSIYFLPAFVFGDEQIEGFDRKDINVRRELYIDAFHDSFCFWFDVPDQSKLLPLIKMSENWHCICGLHPHLSPNRLYSLNDQDLLSFYWSALKAQISLNFKNGQGINILYIGDESILPLLIGRMSQVDRIYVLCRDEKTRCFYTQFLSQNLELKHKVIITTSSIFQDKTISSDLPINGIVSDLYFRQYCNLFPALEYFDLLSVHYKYLTNENNFIFSLPNRIVIKCLLVEFKEFWKSFSDVGTNVEGFDLTNYDELIQNARSYVDWSIEPQRCWEYASRALISESVDLFEFSLTNDQYMDQRVFNKTISIDLQHLAGSFDQDKQWPEKVAIVVWIDQILDQDEQMVISGGPINDLDDPKQFSLDTFRDIEWDRNSCQGVGFLGKDWHAKYENKLDLRFRLMMDKQRIYFQL